MMDKPFLLNPYPKDYLWGGNRLNERYNKNIAIFPFAESWECSTHPDGPSYIASGEYRGTSLIDLIKEDDNVTELRFHGVF